jgi:predicted phage terminase large subunit-like protein
MKNGFSNNPPRKLRYFTGQVSIAPFDFSKVSPTATRPVDTSLAALVESTAEITLENWQRTICTRLDALIHQTGQRVLVHGPPQFGKSLIVSQRFPAKALGERPDLRVRVACYNVSHAERFSKVNLDVMRDPIYIKMFPDAGARIPAICPAEEWSTAARAAKRDANPSFKALGLGTGFTGMGVDILVIDDPYKNAQESRSEAVNTMLWDWWTQVVLARLNPATNIVVMFHRWWEGDFAGKLIESGEWELLRFPAIADGKDGDPSGRAVGEPLSSRYSLEYLANLKVSMGTAFEALYQGTPYPAEGNLFKAGRITFVDAAPAQATRVRRWDVAASANTGDYSAGVLMSRSGNHYIVEDVERGRWATDERDAIIRETAERDKARYGSVTTVLPQDPGSAGVDSARAFVRLLAGFKVETERETGDKVTRADPFASQWNAGNVQLVRGPWNEVYLSELLAFPSGKHDDQVDGSSGGFNRLASTGRPFSAAAGPARFPAPQQIGGRRG